MSNSMIEPIIPPLPTFSLVGPVTFNVHSVEAPFIIHWLEWQAERITDGTYAGEQNWIRAVQLLQAAVDIAGIWPTEHKIRERLIRKMTHARGKRTGR